MSLTVVLFSVGATIGRCYRAWLYFILIQHSPLKLVRPHQQCRRFSRNLTAPVSKIKLLLDWPYRTCSSLLKQPMHAELQELDTYDGRSV